MTWGRRILAALLAVSVPIVGLPATAAGAPPGVVDASNVDAGPVERVIVRWAQGAGAVPRGARASRLDGVLPGIRAAAEVTADTAAYWLPVARTGPAALAELRALARVPGVAEVAPDVRMTADLTPDDTYYAGYQSALFGTWGINAPAAWDVTTGSPSVVVAVIDTGITAHPEFDGRVLPGYDFVADVLMANDGDGRDADPSDPGDWITSAEASAGYFQGCPVDDSSWHGTHVAGTIGAAGNNGTGVAGVAWGASILPVRVLGKCGGWSSDIAAAIRWAAGGAVVGAPANPNPARVLNLSLSGPGSCDATTQSAIDTAIALGATVVVAAGNSGANVASYSPANCAGVVSVAALAGDGIRASFSNYGGGIGIAAPGASIASTLNEGTQGPGAHAYALSSGTSMAAPHVAGVAALALAVNPSLTAGQLRSLLLDTARALPVDASAGGCATVGCGAGLVDAAAAVAAAAAAPDPGVTPAPSDPGASPGPTAAPPTPTPDSTPPTLTTFGPTVASPTNAASLTFALGFNEPVTGLAAGDFTRAGTATGCTVGTPTGGGASWTVAVGGCSQGTVTLSLRALAVTDGAGNQGPGAAVPAPTVTIDRTAPTAGAPTVSLRTGATLAGSALPVRLTWTGADAAGAGIDRFEVARSTDGGRSWSTIAIRPTGLHEGTATSSGTVRYRVRAIDRAGNTGAWATGPVLTPRLVQQTSTTVRFGRGWTTQSAAGFSGSSARYARTAGASASYTFTGRAFALVTTRATTRGRARIYVNGGYAGTVDFGASTTAFRSVAWQRTWTTVATRTVRIVVVGTAGRPRVDLDAVATLR